MFAPSQSGTKVRPEPPCFCEATPVQIFIFQHNVNSKFKRILLVSLTSSRQNCNVNWKFDDKNLLCPLPLAASYVVSNQRAVRERADELFALKVPADGGEPSLGAPVVLLLLLCAQVPEGKKSRLETNQKLGRVGRILWEKTR